MTENAVDFQEFDDALAKAKTVGSFMAAVWMVSDGKVKLLRRSTSKFPRGDFLRAVAQLADLCAVDCAGAEKAKNNGASAVPEPLPRAKPDIKVFPKPDIKIFPTEEPTPEPLAPPVGFSDSGPQPDSKPHLDKLTGIPDPGPALRAITPESDTKAEDDEPCILGKGVQGQFVVNVQRTSAAVVLHVEGQLPVALPAEATEAQVSQAVEVYRSSMGAIK